MTFRFFIAPVLSMACLLTSFPAWASIPTMTVSELQPGMRGVGRTVIQGTQIREFNCEVINVFADMGFDGGPLILVRISGAAVEESGGVAAGYSGSPVFINGRLIGAISWGPYFTKGDVVGVTPIDNMLRALRYEEQKETLSTMEPACLDAPLRVADRTYDSVLLAWSRSEADELRQLWGEETLVLTPVRTPLIVSGLSEQGFNRLKEFAESRLPFFDIVQGPGGGSAQGVPLLLGPSVLEPGASVGAQLASGDLDITAVGTLTWVDEDGRFVAFGHPFLGDGETNMPFITTRIIHTMQSLDRSYKLGEPLETVGTITQDRMAAIGGRLRQVPEMVDFRLEIRDTDLGRTRRFNYSVINKEDWLPVLATIMPMEGLLYSTDRTGPGTCKVSFTIRGEGLAHPIERQNTVYAQYDMSWETLSEFNEALSIVTTMNTFREVKLTSVDIRIEVTQERQTMDIVRARFRNAPRMGPGAVGYRGPEETGEEGAADEGEAIPLEPEEDFAVPESLQGMPAPEIVSPEENMTVELYTPPPGTQLVGYYPGDEIQIVVTLRPYREETIEKVIRLTVPKDFQAGQTTLEVFGGTSYYYGGYGMYSYQAGTSTGAPYTPTPVPPEDLEDLIEQLETRPTGNTLTVRLVQMAPSDPYYYLQDDYVPPKEIKESVTLDEVIYGYYSLPIEILSAESDQTAEGTEDRSYSEEEAGENVPQEEVRSGTRSRNPHRQ